MSNNPQLVSRQQIDVLAWDACVAASSQRIIYGYSWYLDAVLPSPRWSWMGIVLVDDTGQYQAVMPVPLRRKWVAGIPYTWVVHQPFFCQFLAIFSLDTRLDTRPFFQLLTDSFSYGAIYTICHPAHELNGFDTVRQSSTHVLRLASDYKTVYSQYSRDRKTNVHRAEAANWILVDSSDPEPLLELFRLHHAWLMDGGVPDWAYDILRNLSHELIQRNCGHIRYAVRDGHIEAGTLFAQEGGRIIYLFNAASQAGRKGNARTILIDRMIQDNTEGRQDGTSWLFDFESPDKPSVRNFYQRFGAIEQSFQSVRWNRLHKFEQVAIGLRNCVKGSINRLILAIGKVTF
ncbi:MULTISPECIES: GNAT family N-acetyltransferase [unclassified Spirosoma]|uniref:GNAT family N-acetyltransferase n=1 Tax=unclassified Spirosoma TaxID=2621999 RepID=UPI000A7C7A97|nr:MULTISPECIES: GNAT family N-acetyltransferase [unclassified Spirosoma]MBN8826301.1 GNAT family N-acetyltransferase [Spirosoma sp.]